MLDGANPYMFDILCVILYSTQISHDFTPGSLKYPSLQATESKTAKPRETGHREMGGRDGFSMNSWARG